MKKLRLSSHFLVLILLTIFALAPSKSLLFQKTNISKYESAYSQSQYVLGESSPQKIDDDTLYIYAGYAYTKGDDPTTINFEHPPFGKYLIGLSYRVFGSSIFINVFIFFFILLLLYQLQEKLSIPRILRYIPLIILATSSLFRDHLGRGLLDLQQLMFTLLFFNLIIGSHRRKNILLGIVIGIISSIKYPVPLIGLFVLTTLIEAFKAKKLKQGIISIIVGGFTYLLTYIAHFIHHPNPLDFIKFEWYRYKWWTEFRTIPKFLLLKTLFFGTFQSWWDENIYEVAKNFTRLWAALFVANFLSIPTALKKFPKSSYLIFYSSVLLILYLFGSAANERYLIQLIPFWAINLTIFLTFFYKKKRLA